MLAFLRARVLKQRLDALPFPLSSNTHLWRPLLSDTIRSFASKPSSGNGSNSLVVSFLINSCGLSPQSAASASKQVKFQSLENPNLVLNLFKEDGFSQTQISKMVGNRPELLIYDAQKTILPKLELFRSKAISGTELTDAISKYPHLLGMSLDRTLIPCFDFLKSVAQLDDRRIIFALRKSPWLHLSDLDSHFAPNIALLRQLGVPQSSISCLFSFDTGAAFASHSKFVKAVEEVRGLELDPSKTTFVLAVAVVYRMTESKWASKFELFGKYGWSKEEVFEAFKRKPICIVLSEKNISTTMDFLVYEMGWPSKYLVKHPVLLCHSLEKRIKPRCLFVQALMSKGLVGKDLSLQSVLHPTEEKFVEMFVTKFQKTDPELLDVYLGKLDL